MVRFLRHGIQKIRYGLLLHVGLGLTYDVGVSCAIVVRTPVTLAMMRRPKWQCQFRLKILNRLRKAHDCL